MMLAIIDFMDSQKRKRKIHGEIFKFRCAINLQTKTYEASSKSIRWNYKRKNHIPQIQIEKKSKKLFLK